MSRLRVPVGYVVAVVVIALARPRLDWAVPAVGLVVAGEALRVWASGHIEKTQRLATGGPYAHTRNPLYFGSLLLALGVAAVAGHPAAVAAIAVYFVAFYPRVMAEEEHFLRERFGAEYAAWAEAVPRFLPRPTPAGPRGSRFSWARVATNREWRTVASIPVVVALLVLRGHVLP